MLSTIVSLFNDLKAAPSQFWMELFVIVVLASLSTFIVAKSINIALKSKRIAVLDALWFGVRRPLMFQIWLIATYQIVKLESETFGNLQNKDFLVIFSVLGVWSVTWALFVSARRLQANLSDPLITKKPWDLGSADSLRIIIRLVVGLLAVIVTAQMLGFSMSGLVALGGTSGIVLGFAAKDLVANLFGAMMIRMDRPFTVGEWIRSPDKEIEGTVEEIGIRITRIRTFDQRPLYVPNSVFASISIETPSRMRNRRIYETIGVRYDDAENVKSIIDDVRNMLRGHAAIDQRRTLIVNLVSFGPSSLDFFIYTFTKTTDWVRYHQIKEDVLLKVLDVVANHGAEVAFPTQTLLISKDEHNDIPPTEPS